MPRRLGDCVELTGRDGPVFILASDVRRVVRKSAATLVVCATGKPEFVEDDADEVRACVWPFEKTRRFKEPE